MRTPADIVPRSPLSLATVRRLAAASGQRVTVSIPGEVVEDVDGIPNHVTPTTTTSAVLADVVITRAEADRLGITEGEIPNVSII